MADVKAVMVPTDCDGGKSRLELYMAMVQEKNDAYFKDDGLYVFRPTPCIC